MVQIGMILPIVLLLALNATAADAVTVEQIVARWQAHGAAVRTLQADVLEWERGQPPVVMWGGRQQIFWLNEGGKGIIEIGDGEGFIQLKGQVQLDIPFQQGVQLGNDQGDVPLLVRMGKVWIDQNRWRVASDGPRHFANQAVGHLVRLDNGTHLIEHWDWNDVLGASGTVSPSTSGVWTGEELSVWTLLFRPENSRYLSGTGGAQGQGGMINLPGFEVPQIPDLLPNLDVVPAAAPEPPAADEQPEPVEAAFEVLAEKLTEEPVDSRPNPIIEGSILPQLVLTDLQRTINGNLCLCLQCPAEAPERGLFQRIWVDPALDYRIVQFEEWEGTAANTRLSIQYAPHPEFGYLPKRWKHEEFEFNHEDPEHPIVRRSLETKVLSLHVNGAIPQEIWEYELPENLRNVPQFDIF